MKFLRNLHTASELLFFIIGSAMLIAYLFYKNNFYSYSSEIFLRLADIPFALVGILFALTSLRISVNEQLSSFDQKKKDELVEAPMVDAVLIIISFILFLTVLFMNFAVPDLA